VRVTYRRVSESRYLATSPAMSPPQHPDPYLHINALCCQLLCCLQTEPHHLAEGSDSKVLALSHHFGFANGKDKVLVQDLCRAGNEAIAVEG
jgi:hypothetical protein